MTAQLSRSSDLAEQRKAKGISLRMVESSTCITLHFLEAIEAEQFEKLPGGVYTISYLRQYARATGLDEAALVERYREKNAPPPAAEPDASPSRPLRWLREFQFLPAFLRFAPKGHESRTHA